MPSGEAMIADMNAWLKGEPVPPYAELLARWGKIFRMYRDALDDRVDFETSVEQLTKQFSEVWRLRDEVAIPTFGFSLPCAEVLDTLAKHAPILEVGAGTGYWTALMRHRGIEVIGTDPDLQHHWKDGVGRYDPHQARLEAKTAVRRYPDRTVFCSWPSLNQTWFRQALKAMRRGQCVIVIEEDACADDRTWNYRDAHFESEEHITVPAWYGCNDRCGVWRKR